MEVQQKLTPSQIQRLRAQVATYKHLARNEPVPPGVMSQALCTPLPGPYEQEKELENGEKLPYDLMKVLQIHNQRAQHRVTQITQPIGIDPDALAKERENRINNRILLRMKALEDIPVNISENLRIKAEIEIRSLRLLNLQAHVRNEVLGYLKRDTTLETALNPLAYRRTKKLNLREARVMERLEKQQKLEQEKKRRQRHHDLLQAIVTASRDFKEFHRNCQLRHQKVKKAVVTYHANSERERKKDELRNEKMRMMKLMQEDDAGYRALLDEKKDQRLVYLLQQTDEFVESLTGLVRKHQQVEKKKKREERKTAQKALDQQNAETDTVRVLVQNSATGEILTGDKAPRADEIEQWLEAHPGFEVISRDVGTDDEEDDQEKEKKPVEKEEEQDDEFEGMDEETRNRKIIEKARNEEDEYNSKNKKQMESYYATAHRIREKIVKQHSTLGGDNTDLQLKPYQIKGLEWMVSLYNNNLNGILADEMGLGKTIQTVALVTYLMEVKKVNGPYLIIVPLSTISNWNLELEKWAPHVVKVVYKGDREMRKRLESKIRRGEFNVLLTTYDYVLKEKSMLGKIRWKYMIIDEGHRMKNHNCKLTLTLNAYFSAQHRLLLTGTPLQNKLPELWALLNFLLPSIFSSCGTFEQWFNAPFATTGEKVELNQEETMLIIRRLHKVLRPFLLRRLKKEVESELPDKTEYVIKCDMSALQKIVYRRMFKDGMIMGENFKQMSLQNRMVQLRKIANHPFLFRDVEHECKRHWKIDHITGKHLMRVSGKFELLDRILPKLKATGHRVLIFSQMTSLIDIMEDYFLWKEYKYMRLDGSTKHDERGEMLKKFNAPDSDCFIFVLSTRAGGLGLNLQTADTVIIFDSDWNPHQDMQAQDRAHRIGQTKEVRVLRMITVNSVEEKILAAARFKLNVDEKVIQAGMFDQRSTGEERRQMLEQIIKAEEDDDDADEVPEDESINQMVARSEEEFEKFQQMDIDRRRQEASEDNRKPRLVEENEIPQSIIEEPKEKKESADANGKDFSFDSGRRKRREVNYAQDLMSDRAWLREIGEDVEEEPVEEEEEEVPKKRRKREKMEQSEKKRGRKSRGDKPTSSTKMEDEEEED
ncbi:unnamed protein product [Bursaphelenchus okinawaensis]|uniref:Uncharacterized protein n=1 Tax=Bursaphelenchus okinawaensis TaxID=465554 RepID=A0A811KAR2_9BILA|nr:unnamed protein product [Bursaphelenchus okinawaensis]CAG9095988.1 unnamed protein product [Bursaphelenchus okinawaensis]